MTDVRTQLQMLLDGALYSDGVMSYWGEKSDVPSTTQIYAVYMVSNDSNPDYADDAPLSREMYCIIKLYYLKTLVGTSAGRTRIKGYETAIKSALIGADFVVSSFDDNDPADSYAAIVIEATLGEVI